MRPVYKIHNFSFPTEKEERFDIICKALAGVPQKTFGSRFDSALLVTRLISYADMKYSEQENPNNIIVLNAKAALSELIHSEHLLKCIDIEIVKAFTRNG